jgi:type II secretory pathway component PulJ
MVSFAKKPVILRRGYHTRHGYTIAEVLVASGLMVILTTIILSGLLFVQRSSSALTMRAILSDEANLAMLRIERDIDTMVGILGIAENEWTLQILNAAADSPATIVYWYDADNHSLIRIEEASGNERVILESLISAGFVFYDRQSETTNIENIRRIAFAGVLERSAGQRQVVEQLVTASFLIRNRLNSIP